MLKLLVCAVWVCLAMTVIARAAEGERRTVVYDSVATEVAAPAEEAGQKTGDLWVTLSDLTRATKFVLKPQGVCRDELCFPLPKARRNDFLAKRSGLTWFNLSEFARLLKQPAAYDSKHAVWYFGPRPEDQNGYLKTLAAPNFTLPDLNGKPHSLADFRGKKVLLITWASW